MAPWLSGTPARSALCLGASAAGYVPGADEPGTAVLAPPRFCENALEVIT